MSPRDTDTLDNLLVHINYVRRLTAEERGLIEARDAFYHGSWEELEQKSPRKHISLIDNMRMYESQFHINLGEVLREYHRLVNKEKNPGSNGTFLAFNTDFGFDSNL